MRSIDELAKGDYIAFGFNYNGGQPNEIIVENITEVYKNKETVEQVLVHFLYGYKSLAEFVKRDNILAIGNPQGKGVIKDWTGTYDILNQEKIAKISNSPKII
jgi:hypothetical protein